MNNYQSIYRFLIIGVFILLVIFGTVLILVFRQKPKSESARTKVEVIPTPTIKAEGSLTLVKVDNSTYDIVANSSGKDIVGYDILLGFDSTRADLINVLSAEPNFNIFKLQKNNLLIITGTKKLAIKTPTIFSKTKILTIRGASVSIIYQSGKETTKFVDSASKIYYPTISY